MTNRKTELIKHFKTFIETCENNDIWYAAAGTTLQGAIVNEGMIQWHEKIEVMMTIESYEKLKSKAHRQLIDGAMNSTYPLINPKFIPLDEKFNTTNIFIDILIAVPTTTQKVKDWTKISRKRAFLMRKLHSNYIPNSGKEKFLKGISKPFKRRYKQLTFKTAYNKLFEKKNEGYYLIHKPSCKPYQHWIPHITLNTDIKEFEGLKIKIPVEYKTILKVKYGSNYTKLIKHEPTPQYINCVSKVNIKKK